MGLRLTTAPTTLAIDLSTAKDHLRVEEEDDDGYITSVIGMVTREVERRLDAQLINATWTLTLDDFPGFGNPLALDGFFGRSHHGNPTPGESNQYNLDSQFTGDIIKIAKWPLSSVTSIAYLDADGDSQTLSASKYIVDAANIPGRIKPAFGEVWPTTRTDVLATGSFYFDNLRTSVSGGLSTALWRFVAMPLSDGLARFPEVFVGLVIGAGAFALGSLLRPDKAPSDGVTDGGL